MNNLIDILKTVEQLHAKGHSDEMIFHAVLPLLSPAELHAVSDLPMEFVYKHIANVSEINDAVPFTFRQMVAQLCAKAGLERHYRTLTVYCAFTREKAERIEEAFRPYLDAHFSKWSIDYTDVHGKDAMIVDPVTMVDCQVVVHDGTHPSKTQKAAAAAALDKILAVTA